MSLRLYARKADAYGVEGAGVAGAGVAGAGVAGAGVDGAGVAGDGAGVAGCVLVAGGGEAGVPVVLVVLEPVIK
ncbi:hypothetical protein ASF29_18280 [Rhizobium sp. Leaf262]|nr:hypothetical protein ASF29_18280 [Rhizobium sp. Leaf262]